MRPNNERMDHERLVVGRRAFAGDAGWTVLEALTLAHTGAGRQCVPAACPQRFWTAPQLRR
jgi:hypothetical protein